MYVLLLFSNMCVIPKVGQINVQARSLYPYPHRCKDRDRGCLTQNKMRIRMLFPMMSLKMLCVLWLQTFVEFSKYRKTILV